MNQHTKIRPFLRQRIEAQRWFHAIDFGAFSVPSWMYPDGRMPNGHLLSTFEYFSEFSLAGMRCLDFGTYDGMTAFVLERMGAARVDATCQYDLLRFRLANEALGSERVVYHPEVHAEQLIERFGEGAFDLVVIGMALHHFMLPQEALFICRRLLKRGGLFVLGALTFIDPEPAVFLSPAMKKPVPGMPTIWVPTDSAFDGMLKLAGFDPIGTSGFFPAGTKRKLIYSTMLSRAVRPAEIRGRSAELAAIQDTATWTAPIDYRALERPDWPESTIAYSGPEGRRNPDIRILDKTPLQPRWTPPSDASKDAASPVIE